MKWLWVLLLSIPAVGQIQGYNVPATGVGLLVCIGPGSNTITGSLVTFTGSCLGPMTLNSTTFGYLDVLTGTLLTNTTGAPNKSCPIFEADANQFFVTAVRDKRPTLCGGSGGGIPGGSNTQIQFNNSGSFGGLSNVAAGSELVSNGASSNPIFLKKQAIDVRDYGVDCTDTTDSTTALANAITAAGNFGKVVFPANCKVKVSGTPAITLNKVQGLEMEMLGKQGNSCDQSGSSGIDYQQTYASGNTVISILDSQRLRLRNLAIYPNGNADNAVLIDQDAFTPPITTDNIFEGICIYNNTATRNSSFNGFSVSPVSTSNVEGQRFRDVVVVCSNSAPTSATSNGNGFSLTQNSNAVNNEIYYFNSINCSKTINSPGGQEVTYQHALDSTGTTNTNVVLPSVSSAFLFSRFENSNIGVQQTGASPAGPTLIIGNNFTNANTVMDCLTAGCGALTTMISNERDTTPTNWFNLHSNRANSGLFAVNNAHFSWVATDWQNGAFVMPDFTIGSALPTATLTLPLLMTPRLNNSDFGSNFGSPYIDLRSNSGSTPTVDDYYIQQMPAGTFAGATASTLIFGHSPTNGITPWYSFQGTISGIATNAISNPSAPTITQLSGTCIGGATSYSYQVVAHDGSGTTSHSSTASTATGCATLSSSGGNIVSIPSVAGCTYFDVYRTASSGTPSSTGKIGSAPCYNIGILNVKPNDNASANAFYDTGLAGDASSPPSANTTGAVVIGSNQQFTETTAPTGIAATDQLWGDSTAHRVKMNNNNGGATTVAVFTDNLSVFASGGTINPNLVNSTTGYQQNGNAIGQLCGTTSACSATAAALTRTIYGSAPLVSGTPSAVTITGFSPAFTSSTSFFCTVSNATTAADSLKVSNASASSITITGPASVSDTVNYICIGT